MDAGEIIAVIFGIGAVLLVVFGVGLVIIDGLWYSPYRAEDAQTQCEQRGFDVYSEFSGMMRTTAYGVKCEYVDYTRKQINVGTGQQDNQEKLIVVT